jgi:hypothetical protein
MKRFQRLPRKGRFFVYAIGALSFVLAANWVYQVVRKPAELFFPVSGALNKTPTQTWDQYRAIFREHATATITPELLAALAQVEGAGNPVALTAWRLRATSDPREMYRPASSAVGMYQITDGTYREASRYCIRDNVAIEDGCWFNALYLRVVPSHSVEMTSAYLDRRVADTLARYRITRATSAQKHDLAALIHLCGAAAGAAYAQRGFRLTPGQRCGEHDAAAYLARVNAAKRLFARLSALG